MPRSTNRLKARAALSVRGLPGAVKNAVAEWLFDQRLLALALRRQHVVCLGDSHAEIMRQVHVAGVCFRVRSVKGATASGIINPNSVTHARAKLLRRLARARSWQQILLQLGEVDCGFVIWHRAERHGLTIADQLADTLDSYGSFIEELAGAGYRRITVLSAPLPTIDDLPSALQGRVANSRREVTATQAQRTELPLAFNAGLQARCATLGVTFVDVTSGHLDPDTGLVADRFRRQTRANHHLADAPYRELISTELRHVWQAPAAAVSATSQTSTRRFGWARPTRRSRRS